MDQSKNCPVVLEISRSSRKCMEKGDNVRKISLSFLNRSPSQIWDARSLLSVQIAFHTYIRLETGKR